MLGIAGYCCARLLAPSLRLAQNARGLELWHLVMVGAMAGMLLAAPIPGHPRAGMAVFAAGLAWSLFQAGRRHLRAAHLRLAVGCTAMIAMLVPAPVSAAQAQMPTRMQMPMPMDHQAALPGGLVTLLVAGLVVVLAVSVRRLFRRTTRRADRVGAVCEGVMSLAMGVMLLGLT
jgi:hypothetical protein